jgi:hypothetical protein
MTPATKTALLSALFYGALMCFYFSWHHRLLYGIIEGVIAGIIFGFLMYWMARSKWYLRMKNPRQENN